MNHFLYSISSKNQLRRSSVEHFLTCVICEKKIQFWFSKNPEVSTFRICPVLWFFVLHFISLATRPNYYNTEAHGCLNLLKSSKSVCFWLIWILQIKQERTFFSYFADFLLFCPKFSTAIFNEFQLQKPKDLFSEEWFFKITIFFQTFWRKRGLVFFFCCRE